MLLPCPWLVDIVCHRLVVHARCLLLPCLLLVELGRSWLVDPVHGLARHVMSLCANGCTCACRWSLGVTLWQMVAGSLPAWADVQQQQHKHPQQPSAKDSTHDNDSLQQGCSNVQQDLVLPLQPPVSHHATPKELHFPGHFSQVSIDFP